MTLRIVSVPPIEIAGAAGPGPETDALVAAIERDNAIPHVLRGYYCLGCLVVHPADAVLLAAVRRVKRPWATILPVEIDD